MVKRTHCAPCAAPSQAAVAQGSGDLMPHRAFTARRGALLCTTALAGAMLFAALAAMPARADGGTGGLGAGGSGGTGGTTSATSAGGNGGTASLDAGGGGGGAGTTGGNGSNGGGAGGLGGTGGATPGANGNNGTAALDGGGGGGGAHGTAVTTNTINSTPLSGGIGGAGGQATGGVNGSAGAGSVGIVGSGLTVINSGSITGGLSGDGVTRANAITFTGGTNTLELRPGSTITGNVVAFSTADTLALGGSGSASFDVSQIRSSAQYQGFGVFQKTGASTWTLTGTTGTVTSWTVNGGTLQAGATNVLGSSSAITVASGAMLNLAGFNQTIGSLAGAGAVTLGSATLATGNDNTSTTFSGTISGTGGLTKIGNGTLTLSGSSTYAGATAVNAGTLAAGATNAFSASSAFTVASGATLSLAGFNQTIGSLAGAGAVTLGSATLTTGIDNTSTTFSGGISGTGGLTKAGSGTLTLSGSSSYSGATAVNAGTLTVNGSIANSAVTINSGGTLSGTGTVGGLTIASGGTFAPGNSPGTMTVAGNLAFQSGAIYLVQVNPSTASSTNVTSGGSATLAGTVQAAFAAGSYATRTYTILSAAGGLGGTTFNTLTTSNLPAGFTASLSYTATDAILNLTAILGQPSGPSGPSGPGALACAFSINQCNVANALNAFFNNGGALPPNFVTIFGLTGANLANALTLLSGEAATDAQQVGFQLTNQFLGIMLDPFVDGRSEVNGRAIAFAPEREELPDEIALAYAKILKEPPKPPSFEQRWSVWGAGYGGSNRTTGDPAVVGSHDLSAATAGGAAGLDYRLAPGTVVGFALAGGGTNWSLAQGIGGGKSDAFQAGVYGTARSGPAYLAAALAYTNHWMSTDRFAFAGDHLSASFNAQSFGGRVEGGYRFATIYGGLTPYAAIQAQSFHTPSYNESDLNAGGFGLAFNSRSATDTRSELGGRFDRLLLLNPEAALTLRARVAWAHDWISDPSLAAVFQTLPGASFVVNGATPAKNSALTSAGAEYRLANGVVLLAKFDGEFASHSSTYAGTGTVRYTW